MTKYTTLSAHIGDRPQEPYLPGETREVDDENTVKHLTEGDSPVLGDYDEKAEKTFLNKAEGKAPANKKEA